MRLALSCGEPAGVGPDLIVKIAQEPLAVDWVVFADPELLQQRAEQLDLPLRLLPATHSKPCQPGELKLAPIKLAQAVQAGQLDVANVPYVLESLTQATDACLNGMCDALVTPPLHKGIINSSGIAFTGHTEFLAQRCQTETVVMMLSNAHYRVALATTHCPLTEVAKQLSTDKLIQQCQIIIDSMQRHAGIEQPRLGICGLNPHAGEQGFLGQEEQTIILPAIKAMQQAGFSVQGPLSADTIFVPHRAKQFDVILCQYHDQGLPVIKATGFGQTVNTTLGLPFIRTSVDHGTALDCAGTHRADHSSLRAAILQAMVFNHEPQTA